MKAKFSTRVVFLFSMVVFGTIALFVRNIALSSAQIALARAVLAAALVGIYLLLRKTNPVKGLKAKDLALLLISGGAMGFNWIFLFEAYRYTTVSLSTLCYYFAPILVTLLSPFLFRERIGTRGVICFLAATAGLVMIVGVSGAGGGNHLVGILFGIGAATLYATVMLLNKAIKSVGGLPRTFLQFLAAIAVLLPYVLITDGGLSLGNLDSLGWAYLLVVGLVHTGVTYCLYFSTLWRLPGQEAAILSYVDPLVAVLVSVAFLGEPITAWQIAGGLLIIGASLVNEIRFKRKKT